MKVFVVYCHPSENSFTYKVYRQFLKGLASAGHEVVVSDLYKMNFRTDISEEEYLREIYYRADESVPEDVAAEQEKIQSSDAIVFIYPVFWTEAPETVMLGDRIRERAKQKEMVILDGITNWNEEKKCRLMPEHLKKAYELGVSF